MEEGRAESRHSTAGLSGSSFWYSVHLSAAPVNALRPGSNATVALNQR